MKTVALNKCKSRDPEAAMEDQAANSCGCGYLDPVAFALTADDVIFPQTACTA